MERTQSEDGFRLSLIQRKWPGLAAVAILLQPLQHLVWEGQIVLLAMAVVFCFVPRLVSFLIPEFGALSKKQSGRLKAQGNLRRGLSARGREYDDKAMVGLLVTMYCSARTPFLRTKRVASAVSGTTVGIASIITLYNCFVRRLEVPVSVGGVELPLFASIHMPKYLEVAICSHLGVLTADMLTLTDKQAKIPSLILHHVATVFCFSMGSQHSTGPFGMFDDRIPYNHALMAYAGCFEATAIGWYPYWILVQDYRHGSLYLKRAVGLLAVSTFFLLRIFYAQPGLLYTAYTLLRYEQGIVHGVACMTFVLGFIYLNLLNFTKLVSSVMRLYGVKLAQPSVMNGPPSLEKSGSYLFFRFSSYKNIPDILYKNKAQ